MAERTPNWADSVRHHLAIGLGVLLPVFVLIEANFALLRPQSQLAIFAGAGLVICFSTLSSPWADRLLGRILDLLLIAASLFVSVYIVVHTEPWTVERWTAGVPLGERAGLETQLDIVVGVVGLGLVLEACRRATGWALPILSLTFLAYGFWGNLMPDWLMPHRGYSIERLVSQTFLHSQGVFGLALHVMFAYVFLFVVFGAILEATGATKFVLDASQRLFGRSRGGTAKVAVFSSGLLGSLSGSAVANTVTSGTFTIPMMRSAGFSRTIAAGVEAAASSGGALVPPVMGAGAYMMLEVIDPPVTYLQIIRAALIPAILYYVALLLMVHFHACRVGAAGGAAEVPGERTSLWRFEGVVFVGGLLALVVTLLSGFSIFRAVTIALFAVGILATAHARTRFSLRRLAKAFRDASVGGVPLITAASCVGIVLGVVTLTGVGTRLPAMILPLAEQNLGAALALIMVSSIILGMGLPSAVCYLLMATLIGPVLGNLGVVPLAAHMFVFYFGMMSMVTPPVALASYAASMIAGAELMPAALASFRFALVGFTLPFMFVFRPELLMLDSLGGPASTVSVIVSVALALLGILPLAAAIGGFLFRRLTVGNRILLLAASFLALLPAVAETALPMGLSFWNVAGLLLFFGIAIQLWRRERAVRQP